MVSEECSVGYGVPQGSILGPLLFVIFINDLPDHLTQCRSHLYADDTAITVTGYLKADLESQLNERLKEAKEWMDENILTLNLKKTNAMVFGTRHTVSQLGDLNVSCNGVNIEIVEKVKYLGIILDRELKFSEHVSYLKQKLIGRTKMLGKLRPIIGQNLTLELYKSLILPVMDYGDIVYDCLSSKSSKELQRLQNYALHIVLRSGFEKSISDMHKETNLMFLSDRRHSHTLNYVYKCLNGLAPEHVAQQLQPVADAHNRNTRAANRDDLLVPALHLDMTRRSFRFRGPFYWNLTECPVRTAPSIQAFKSAVKRSDMFDVV